MVMDASYAASSGDKTFNFLAEQLIGGTLVPAARIVHGPKGSPVEVGPDTPMPVVDAALLAALQTAATAAGQAAAQAVLQQILAKLPAAPATDTGVAALGTQLQTLATAAGQVTALAVFQQMLAKMPASPATDATVAALGTQLQVLAGYLDGVEGLLASIDGKETKQLGAGAVTPTTQRVTLASDGPEVTNSTASKLSLANIDAKLPSASAGRLPAETDDRVLTSLIDDSTAGVTYICEAPPGTATSAAAWRISKVTVVSGVTRITWAASGAMTQIADNRAALPYA